MMRAYEFAGITILVELPDDKMYENEYRLTPFAKNIISEVTDVSYKYIFEMVDKLDSSIGECIVREGDYQVYQHGDEFIRYVGSANEIIDDAYIRIITKGKESRVQVLKEKFPERVGAKVVLNAMDVKHLIVQNKGVILHSSYIERNGKALLFTAPSETGKSTQAELWRKLRNTEIINGDRAVVRIVDGQIVADGVPFAGSSKYCENRSMPIEAIVYLGQAEQTYISKISGYKAFSKIWEGVAVNTWHRRDVEQVADIIKEVVEKVPIYYLRCTPDESAVIALEKELGKE